MSILMTIFPACHGKFEIRIEGALLTEPVVFFIGHYIHYKTMSFFSILFCMFLIIMIWSRKKKGNRCDLKNINYNKVNSSFVPSVSMICAKGKCPGGLCPRNICCSCCVTIKDQNTNIYRLVENLRNSSKITVPTV